MSNDEPQVRLPEEITLTLEGRQTPQTAELCHGDERLHALLAEESW
jgi:hypothetical protein